MITRRGLALFGGLMTGAAGPGAAARTEIDRAALVDGSTLRKDLEGAGIPAAVTSIRTGGDTAAGVGAAWFSTRRTHSPYARTFTAADGRVFEMLPELDGWSLAAFGMLPCAADETAQAARNRAAHQSAIDHAIWLAMNGHGAQRLVFTPGQYHVDGALEVFSYDKTDGSFRFVTLEIAAPARGYVQGQRTSIRNTNIDQPCYAVQASRNVKFSGFSIIGHPGNLVTPTYAQLVGDPARWSNPARMRATRWSPAAAIVVDPFGSSIVDGDAYPGLERYYTYGSHGSSATTLENMELQGFPVGVLLSPSRDTQNNDSVMIRDSDLSYNTVAVATCQSQNRAVRIENCRIGACHVMLDTVSFGVGDGAFPIARDLNVTFCKYLINAEGGASRGKIVNCDVESTYSIGSWHGGGFPLDIEGCQIKLIPPVAIHPPGGAQQPDIDYHLSASGPVNVIGGYVGFYSNAPVPLSIVGAGPVRFTGATLDMPVIAESYDNVFYDGVSLRYLDSGFRYGATGVHAAQTEAQLAVNVDAMMPLGGMAICGSDGETRVYRTRTGVSVLTLDTAAITAPGDGTASFATATPDKYRRGEWLCTTSVVNVRRPDGRAQTPRHMRLGQVASIEAGRIRLLCVPASLTTGRYEVAVQSLRPFRRRCIGAGARGARVLTGVVPADHGFKAGDRLLATAAIQEGTFVTAVDPAAGTITISRGVAAPGLTQIKTAELLLEDASASEAPTRGVTYAGDFIRNRAPAPDAEGWVVMGWLAISDGDPGVMAPQYAWTRRRGP